ncbi:MAG TPA: hypothetical protein VHP83_08010 [Aggregatilineaceae bacterium]|nr:hypothetical protein [Aggregatilineaceae bacterium]
MTDALKNDELADELYTLVQQIQPSPTFLVELEEQFNQEKKLMRNKFSRLAWISVIVAVLLGALVLSPTLRGLAQDVWRFFVPGESDTQTTTTHAPPENQSNLMSQDVAAAPFAVWYPDAVPGAYVLDQTTYDASGSTLIYECNVEGWGFAIRQHPLSDEELATEPYF